jgi:hypothetical protein
MCKPNSGSTQFLSINFFSTPPPISILDKSKPFSFDKNSQTVWEPGAVWEDGLGLTFVLSIHMDYLLR